MRTKHYKLKTFLLDNTVSKKMHVVVMIELMNKNTPQIAFLFRSDGGVLNNPPDFIV